MNIFVQSFNFEINNINLETRKYYNPFDISHIRTEHMNAKERITIALLIKEYSEIFRTDDKP